MIEIVSKFQGIKAERTKVDSDRLSHASPRFLIASSPTPSELDAITARYKLKRGNLKDALDVNESPRLDHDTSHGYLYLRCPHIGRDGMTSTSPILFVYSSDVLIAVFDSEPDSLTGSLSSSSDLTTRNPQAALLYFLDSIASDYDIDIRRQSEAIKKIIVKMRRHKLENEDFVRFVLIEEQINNFLSALTPVVPLLRRLSASKYLMLSDGNRDQLEDIMLAVEQSIHICESNKSRIISIREAYATLSNNSLNRTMKALTAATMFIALPNVVFGMYGMNIALPIQHEPWAFVAIIVSTIAAVVAIILVAKRRHWF